MSTSPDEKKEEKPIIVVAKDLTVLLVVINTEGHIRCIEHVGGNTLSTVLLEHVKTHSQVELEEGHLITPMGADVYAVSKDYLVSINGLLTIGVDILDRIADNDRATLVIIT